MIYAKIVKRKSRGKHEFAGLPCWTFLLLEEEARKCFANAVELDPCSRSGVSFQWLFLLFRVSCFMFLSAVYARYLNNRGLACYHLEKSAPKIWRVHIRRVEMWNLIA